MRRILSVASECAPIVKTGGLADVVGALPGALTAKDCEMRVMLPGYPQVLAALEGSGRVLEEDDLFGGPGAVLRGRAAGLELYALDAPHLFGRKGEIYLGPDGRDWPDNPQRFAALSWMAARLAAEGEPDWRPDVLHAHDWQAGLAPLYLAGRVRSVATIHNIAFQGIAPGDLRGMLRLPESGFNAEGYEFWGRISALKAGLVYGDRITTVSPTYASELKTPAFGMGLQGVISARGDKLCGILNGVDTDVWDPARDAAIRSYSSPRGKRRARQALLDEAGLADGDGPVLGVVSRLTEQKGLDLLLAALPELLRRGGRLVLLGSGDAALEASWRAAAEREPGVAVRIGYDDGLSHRIIAGADAIAVPSRFEPCGLTQLYALRYGAVPVVALTGGLADTVIHASPMALRTGVATGIQFHPVNAQRLGEALAQLCDLYHDPPTWARLQRNAMRQPVGWNASAAEYAALYHDLIEDR